MFNDWARTFLNRTRRWAKGVFWAAGRFQSPIRPHIFGGVLPRGRDWRATRQPETLNLVSGDSMALHGGTIFAISGKSIFSTSLAAKGGTNTRCIYIRGVGQFLWKTSRAAGIGENDSTYNKKKKLCHGAWGPRIWPRPTISRIGKHNDGQISLGGRGYGGHL